MSKERALQAFGVPEHPISELIDTPGVEACPILHCIPPSAREASYSPNHKTDAIPLSVVATSINCSHQHTHTHARTHHSRTHGSSDKLWFCCHHTRTDTAQKCGRISRVSDTCLLLFSYRQEATSPPLCLCLCACPPVVDDSRVQTSYTAAASRTACPDVDQRPGINTHVLRTEESGYISRRRLRVTTPRTAQTSASYSRR